MFYKMHNLQRQRSRRRRRRRRRRSSRPWTKLIRERGWSLRKWTLFSRGEDCSLNLASEAAAVLAEFTTLLESDGGIFIGVRALIAWCVIVLTWATTSAWKRRLDLVHTYPGIFENGDFSPYLTKSASTRSVVESCLTVHANTKNADYVWAVAVFVITDIRFRKFLFGQGQGNQTQTQAFRDGRVVARVLNQWENVLVAVAWVYLLNRRVRCKASPIRTKYPGYYIWLLIVYMLPTYIHANRSISSRCLEWTC